MFGLPSVCITGCCERAACAAEQRTARRRARVARELQREPRLSVAFHFLVALVAGSMRKAALKIARSAVVSTGAIDNSDARVDGRMHTRKRLLPAASSASIVRKTPAWSSPIGHRGCRAYCVPRRGRADTRRARLLARQRRCGAAFERARDASERG